MEKINKIINNKIYIAFISFSIILLCLIVSKIELYADDFFYKSFLNDGFENFVEQNINHYNEANGRVWIHILDQFVLNTNVYVYMAFLIACLLYDFYCGSKFILSCTNHLSKKNLIYTICTSIILFLIIDVYVLKETAFWITGAFNYILPVTISIWAMSNIKKVLDNNKINVLQVILLFLAGASTEQGFMLLFFFSVAYIIFHNIDKKIIFNKNEIIILASEICGFTTMFLSPGAQIRAEGTNTIFNTSIIELFENYFLTFAMRLIGENSIFLIISLLVISIAILTLIDKKINKIVLTGFLISLAIIVVNLLKIYINEVVITMMIVVILYVIIAIVELFKIKNYRNIAIILTSTFLLQGATFALSEVSYRSMFILAFLSVICIANIITIISSYFNKEEVKLIPITILFIVSCINGFQILQGYNYNKSIFNKMRESINNYESNGFVEIDLNIDKKYAYTMGYENGAFINLFFENYGIKDIEDKVYFVSNKESEIYVYGKKLTYPAMFKEGEIYVPTRFIVNSLGGECEWTIATTKYYCGDYYVVIDNYSNSIIDCSNNDNMNINLDESFKTFISRTYINLKDLKYIIGEIEDGIISISSSSLESNKYN